MAISFEDISLLAANNRIRDLPDSAFGRVESTLATARVTNPLSAFSNLGQVAGIARALQDDPNEQMREASSEIRKMVRDIVEE